MKTLALCCCFAFIWVPQHLLAQPSAATTEGWREHLLRGERLYTLGKFEEAVKEFEAGYEIEPRSAFLFNLGQCHRQLERYEKAIWYFERFVARAAAPPEVKRDVERIVGELRTALQKKEKTLPPTGPLRDAEGRSLTTDRAAKNVEEAKPPAESVQTNRRPHRAAWYDDPLGWGMTGAGLLTGAGTAALFVSASGLDREAQRVAGDSVSRSEELRDRAGTRRVFGMIAGIGGGALLAAGVIKLVLHSQPTQTSSVSVVFLVDGVGVVGRF